MLGRWSPGQGAMEVLRRPPEPAVARDPALDGPAVAPAATHGEAPPLPLPLQTSGLRWLLAGVVLVGLSILIFARGLRGVAVEVTVVDDAVVGWLAGLRLPAGRGLADAGGHQVPGGSSTGCSTGCWWRWRCCGGSGS